MKGFPQRRRLWTAVAVFLSSMERKEASPSHLPAHRPFYFKEGRLVTGRKRRRGRGRPLPRPSRPFSSSPGVLIARSFLAHNIPARKGRETVQRQESWTDLTVGFSSPTGTLFTLAGWSFSFITSPQGIRLKKKGW
jgi:hypothetical protein